MDADKTFSLIAPKDLSALWYRDLFFLYRPLIGEKAAILYCVLVSVSASCTQTSFSALRQLAGASSDAAVQKARRILEQYELIRTYGQPGSRECECMMLCSPRRYDAFFSHEVFRRLFFDRVSEEGVECLHQADPQQKLPANLTNISDRLDMAGLDEHWNSQLEERMNRVMPRMDTRLEYDFRFDLFYPRTEARYPKRLRTPANEERIARLASLYGQDEEQMRKVVMKAFIKNEKGHKIGIDFERIAARLEQAASAAPSRLGRRDDYSQSPLGFLMQHQPENAIVTREEKALLRRLASVHGFSHEVINTIIEYVMAQNGGALYIRYADTLANNLARKKVATRKDALEALKNPFPDRGVQKGGAHYGTAQPDLPEWWSQTEDTLLSEEEAEAYRRQLDSMLGALPEEDKGEENGKTEVSL